MKPKILNFVAMAALAALAPTIQAQVAIPESVALPSSAIDKTKPGFKVRVNQATLTLGELPNTLTRTEAQLAGLLLKPDGTPYENVADKSSFNPDGTYDEPGVIAYVSGAFPGIPGPEGNPANIALEAITYADLQPGTYSMVVNSDDGFRVTTGDVRDRAKEIRLGFFDGGRGAADTVFTFSVTKAGVYPFRMIYEQGGGGYNVEWFTASPTDASNRVHLNEDGGIKTYRALAAGVVQGPAIVALSPAQGAINVTPSAGLTAVIEDGAAAVATSSVKLSRNNVDVTATTKITKSGNRISVAYSPATLPTPLAKEEYKLTFDDTTAAGGKREAVVTYTVAAYANYTLPAPLWFEGFDSVAEGSLPAGWTTFSPIDPSGSEDLSDPNSDSFLVWTVISKQRVQDLNGKWEAGRRLNYPEAYINGQKITGLINNNFAYHESDVRGGSQYAQLISPSINLTGKTDVYLVYNSIYEQNQDNVAGTEYSIDDGKTWLPVVYMIDVPDIALKADGTVDAEATLTATQNDTAIYTDATTGEEIGHSYGAFVKADKATWKDLGSYISGRINDNATESKRIEKFRLTKADGQGKVRLRFFQAGTGSWYYGVDNVGLYSITVLDPPILTAQPESASRIAGGSVKFSVASLGTQLAYQWQKGGVDIAGATSATYEIKTLKKSDAGKYKAIIKNSAGTVTSAEAVLTVLDVPGDASSLKNGLAVYLPFDGNYTDASGNNVKATAVGAPTFAPGRIGQGIHVRTDKPKSVFDYVTLGNGASVQFGASKAFAVAFWVQLNGYNADPAFISNKNWGSGGNEGWVVATDGDGRIQWNYRRKNPDQTRRDFDSVGGLVNDKAWHHVIVSFDINGNGVTYYDGNEILLDRGGASGRKDLTPSQGMLFDTALALNIGQDGTGQYSDVDQFDAVMDDVAIWNRALTSDEALTLYAFGLFGESFANAGPVTDQLAAYLKFDGDLKDSSGNGVDGTAVGTVSFVPGRIGQGVRLNTDKPKSIFNYVTLGNGSKVQFGATKDFSVAFWSQLNGYNADPAFISNKNWGSGGNEGWVIATDSDGRVQWNYRRKNPDQTRRDFDSVGGLVNDKAWHHVVVTFGITGNAVTYVDGNEVLLDRGGASGRKDLVPAQGTLFDPTMALNIGQDGTGKYSDVDLFDGVMDDVAIWNRSLSSREVIVLYSRGLNGLNIDGTPSGGVVTSASIGFSIANNQLSLTWTGAGYVLEENTAVANAGGWTAVAGAGANSATLPLSASAKFYRLKK